MVGLSDLKNYAGNLKDCRMSINEKYCYFRLSGLTTYDFLDILNYKSWVYKTYQKSVTMRYVNIIKKLEKGNALLRTSVGFAPLLLRFLREKGFGIDDRDIEIFRARRVIFPDLKIRLYDFQDRMINNWLAAGGIGVIKSATGSGKCCKGNTLVLTDRGLIKIEDIVIGISDSKNRDIMQQNLYDSFGQYGEKFVDNDNIKNLDKVVSISPKLNYGTYNISGKYDMKINDTITVATSIGFEIGGTPEHKIIVIDNNGDLIFKKLGDITKEDNIAISYNTNVFNSRLKLNYHYRIYNKNIKNTLQNIEYMNEDIAALLGYAIAEGSDALDARITITNYDEDIVNNIIRICQNLGMNARRDEYNDKMTGVSISSVELVDFMYYLGYKHGAKNKEMPWSILQADRKSQIVFIRTLFDCDGTVYQNAIINDENVYKEKTKELVEYYSSSYELCRQLQITLLNMGIIARLNSKKGAINEYRGSIREYEESYRLSITGGEILKFADIIGFGLKRKQDILDRCVDILKSRDRWTDITYPNIDKKLNILYERLKLLGKKGQIIKTWEEDFELGGKKIKIARKKKISSTEYLDDCEFNRPMWAYITGERYPSKDTLKKILYILGPTEDMVEYKYLKLLSDMFIFDKVDDIKKEKDNVYDVTIDDVHSYIGNGIVNHNTIIACGAIKEIGRKTLILVHTSDLLINVWNDSLSKAFGPGIMSYVGIVGGGLTDRDRTDMRVGVRSGDFDENMRKDIVIATFQTLVNHIDRLSDYKFGLMVVDECIPIDSKIWTKNGIINYENLSLDNGIYQVWSRDDNCKVVNNGYKKIKTRFKHMHKTVVETGDELVCSLDHKVLSKKNDGSIEFVEIEKAKNVARSLIKPYDVRKECILARSFGYVLGDGWVDVNRDSGAGGDYKGLIRLQDDLKILYYYSNIGKERNLESTIDSISSGQLIVSGTVHNIKFEKRFSELLIKLGHPIGRKTDQAYYIPDWIMNGDINVKREFVAGYLGAEASNPGFRGSKDNKLKKSFFVPRFSINKRVDLVDEGLEFINQFEILLKDLGIDVSSVDVIEGNIRKDGTVSKKIVVTISNQVDNLRRYLDIGYRYCHEKEKEAEIIRLFLRYIYECNKERNNIQEQVRELYDKGIDKINRIVAVINGRTSQKDIMSSWGIEKENDKIINKKCLVSVTEGMVLDILYPHKRENGTDIVAKTAKIKEEMYSFQDWLQKLSGDFIFLDIVRHEYREYEQGYTLTVNKDHNYLVNGFVVCNCHHVPAQMFRKVNAAIRAPYKLGLSATLKRLDGLEKDVYGSLGDIQSSVTIRELINKGMLAEPRFQSPIIVDKGIIESIEKCGHGGLNLSRYVKKMSASSEKKKDYIVNICKNIAGRNRRFLLFADYVKAEDVFIRDMYADSLLKEGVTVSIVDQGMSSDERSTVFNYLDSGEISGIVFGKLGGEGINIPSVDVVVMCNGFKSPITFAQRVGRAMRKIEGKEWCDIYEILLDTPMELKWSEFNFMEYKMEGFQKLVYRVE